MSSPPEVPNNLPENDKLLEEVSAAIDTIDLSKDELNIILEFFQKNADPLFTGQDTFFILGSYKKYPMRRLRIVENTINKRMMNYGFILADLLEPDNLDADFAELPTLHCKFRLLSLYADNLVVVVEGRHAGPSVELGEITQSKSMRQKCHVLQRIYEGLCEEDLETDVDPKDPYSQVQIDKFKVFERWGNLFTWETKEELAERTTEVATS